MRRFDYLLHRIAKLEPDVVDASLWPPTPGTFSFHMWTALGQPVERMNFWELYTGMAKQCWENYSGKD